MMVKLLQLFLNMTTKLIDTSVPKKDMAAANSTFAIVGVSCSADSLVVAKIFVLRINISGKNPAHRQSANRYGQA